MDKKEKVSIKKKILVVEDEDYLRDIYIDVLEEEGYEVDQASDGEKGFTKMKAGGYDLVLLDLMLPKIDGLEILRKLKKSPSAKPNKNIVLLTNLNKDLSISKGIAIKIQGYLIKSDLTPGQFLEKVKKYLNGEE